MEPFKVVCINKDQRFVGDGRCFGEICTVVGIYKNGYTIAGYRPHEVCYLNTLFIVVSDKSVEFKATTFKEIIETVPACDN